MLSESGAVDKQECYDWAWNKIIKTKMNYYKL